MLGLPLSRFQSTVLGIRWPLNPWDCRCFSHLQTPVFQYWPLPEPARLNRTRPSTVLNSNTNALESSVKPTSIGIQYCTRPSPIQPCRFRQRPVLENRGLEMAVTPAVPRVQRPKCGGFVQLYDARVTTVQKLVEIQIALGSQYLVQY